MSEYNTAGISNGTVEIEITTKGPEDQAEKVHMHAHDEAVKAMQAFEDGKPPKECEGIPFGVAWDRVLAEGTDED